MSRWRDAGWRGPAEHGPGGAGADPLIGSVSAVSVGIVEGSPRLDLHYDDDVNADTDMNVVMTGDGRYVEVQGTAEQEPFDRALLDQLLDLAASGVVSSPAAAAGPGMTRIVLASRNPGKIAELQRILVAAHLPATVVGAGRSAIATSPNGATFAENAAHKAKVVAEHTGLIAVADDSGLCRCP